MAISAPFDLLCQTRSNIFEGKILPATASFIGSQSEPKLEQASYLKIKKHLSETKKVKKGGWGYARNLGPPKHPGCDAVLLCGAQRHLLYFLAFPGFFPFYLFFGENSHAEQVG